MQKQQVAYVTTAMLKPAAICTWYILSHSDNCAGGLLLDGIRCFLIEPELQAAARQLRKEAAESYSG